LGTHFHGLGASADDEKGGLLRYFRAIDRGLHEMLREERAPLMLAAARKAVSAPSPSTANWPAQGGPRRT
jgi:hypothetical protein